MKNKINFIPAIRYSMLIICAGLLFSCNSSKKVTRETFTYFQNGLDSLKYIQSREPVIQNNDLLAIQVLSTSLNQEQTIPYNMPASPAGSNSGYLVNLTGHIDMPILGSIKAAGLTQAQLKKVIEDRLAPYVKDPSVIVHFLQFKVNILGEVNSPGTKKFDADRVTIIDALSTAGDLTDNAERADIQVIREENNVRKIYRLDIRSGSLFQSPAYLLQSNDLIYVGASDQKFRQLKANTSSITQSGMQIFATVISLLTSVIFAINIFK